MQFKNFFFLASIASMAYGATVADVLADLSTVSTRVSSLDSLITAFPNPGGTLTQALAIHSSAVSVKSAVDSTTADAVTLPTPVSLADGTSILNAVLGIRPTIEHALVQIVAKKPAFDALPIGGIPALVRQDLADLQTSTNALEDALIARTPESLLPQAEALRDEINAAFATAVAAYN